ncbi:MAG: hypothetical protein KF700_11770, partial [Hyphomonadaceae bacterium]|nr:hypothetical protein [Hyphomonadaceae bacterium]
VLATIRSRCRRLALRALDEPQVRAALGGAGDEALVKLAKGRPGRAIALQAQGLGAAASVLNTAEDSVRRGEARAVMTTLYEKMSGEPYERLAGVLELAGEWTRAAGAADQNEAWAEAWSALEALRSEAEGLDMDPRHALARAVALVERAAGAARR